MVFSSSVFLFLFLPTVLFVYYVLLRRRQTRNYFLLLASLFFYAWGEPWFVFVMILSILGNWFFGLLLARCGEEKRRAQGIVALTVFFNLVIIFIFKYLMFTLRVTNGLFGTDFVIPKIVLPIGISFFTFQALSYVIDIYRVKDAAERDALVQKNPLNVGLYIALFPQLIAGPIVRYSTIADQIQNRRENFDDFSQGVCRFIIGLAKKVILANTIAVLSDQVYSTPADKLTIVTAWLGAVGYTFQIYFDFCGYSDMAIGLGKMFGFHFLENFNYPYISRSISEFWRRWHISLGSWFRDYLYFPLGGSRVSKGRLIFNLFVVWFLTGFWHGADWTYICWGIYFFIFICIEKMTMFEKKGNTILGKTIKWFYMFLVIIFSFVIFRSNTVSYAVKFFGVMFGLGNVPLTNAYSEFYLSEYAVTLILCAVCSTPLLAALEKKVCQTKYLQWAYLPSMLALFFITLCFAIHSTYNPFIYFNF